MRTVKSLVIVFFIFVGVSSSKSFTSDVLNCTAQPQIIIIGFGNFPFPANVISKSNSSNTTNNESNPALLLVTENTTIFLKQCPLLGRVTLSMFVPTMTFTNSSTDPLLLTVQIQEVLIWTGGFELNTFGPASSSSFNIRLFMWQNHFERHVNAQTFSELLPPLFWIRRCLQCFIHLTKLTMTQSSVEEVDRNTSHAAMVVNDLIDSAMLMQDSTVSRSVFLRNDSASRVFPSVLIQNSWGQNSTLNFTNNVFVISTVIVGSTGSIAISAVAISRHQEANQFFSWSSVALHRNKLLVNHSYHLAPWLTSRNIPPMHLYGLSVSGNHSGAVLSFSKNRVQLLPQLVFNENSSLIHDLRTGSLLYLVGLFVQPFWCPSLHISDNSVDIENVRWERVDDQGSLAPFRSNEEPAVAISCIQLHTVPLMQTLIRSLFCSVTFSNNSSNFSEKIEFVSVSVRKSSFGAPPNSSAEVLLSQSALRLAWNSTTPIPPQGGSRSPLFLLHSFRAVQLQKINAPLNFLCRGFHTTGYLSNGSLSTPLEIDSVPALQGSMVEILNSSMVEFAALNFAAEQWHMFNPRLTKAFSLVYSMDDARQSSVNAKAPTIFRLQCIQWTGDRMTEKYVNILDAMVGSTTSALRSIGSTIVVRPCTVTTSLTRTKSLTSSRDEETTSLTQNETDTMSQSSSFPTRSDESTSASTSWNDDSHTKSLLPSLSENPESETFTEIFSRTFSFSVSSSLLPEYIPPPPTPQIPPLVVLIGCSIALCFGVFSAAPFQLIDVQSVLLLAESPCAMGETKASFEFSFASLTAPWRSLGEATWGPIAGSIIIICGFGLIHVTIKSILYLWLRDSRAGKIENELQKEIKKRKKQKGTYYDSDEDAISESEIADQVAQKDFAKGKGTLLSQAQSLVRFPALCFLVFAYFWPGLAVFCWREYTSPPDRYTVLGGVLAGIGFLVGLLAFYYSLFHTPRQGGSTDSRRSFRGVWVGYIYCFEHSPAWQHKYIIPEGAWAPVEYSAQFFPLFHLARNSKLVWFTALMPPIKGWLFALLASFQGKKTFSRCWAQFAQLGFLSFVFLLIVVICRPYRFPILNVLACCVCISQILVAAAEASHNVLLSMVGIHCFLWISVLNGLTIWLLEMIEMLKWLPEELERRKLKHTTAESERNPGIKVATKWSWHLAEDEEKTHSEAKMKHQKTVEAARRAVGEMMRAEAVGELMSMFQSMTKLSDSPPLPGRTAVVRVSGSPEPTANQRWAQLASDSALDAKPLLWDFPVKIEVDSDSSDNEKEEGKRKRHRKNRLEPREDPTARAQSLSIAATLPRGIGMPRLIDCSAFLSIDTSNVPLGPISHSADTQDDCDGKRRKKGKKRKEKDPDNHKNPLEGDDEVDTKTKPQLHHSAALVGKGKQFGLPLLWGDLAQAINYKKS